MLSCQRVNRIATFEVVFDWNSGRLFDSSFFINGYSGGFTVAPYGGIIIVGCEKVDGRTAGYRQGCHYIADTTNYNTSGSNLDGQIYIDGNPVVTSNADYWAIYNNSDKTLVGGNASGSSLLKGRIYCLRFYDRKLTASEIAANYAIDKARFGLP